MDRSGSARTLWSERGMVKGGHCVHASDMRWWDWRGDMRWWVQRWSGYRQLEGKEEEHERAMGV